MKSREFLISDILDVSWGDTKTTKSAYVESGYIAYSAAGPDGFLPHADYNCDGVVLSAIGANCGVTYLASGQWSCIKNTIRILPRTSDIDIKYFYYLTCSPDFWPKRGSAQPFISQTDIRDLLIQIPPIEIQKAIVGIIEQLDHKIKVNLQITSTLERIAQTVFKSWFIDFDPVHAKARGEQPIGMDAETAALFPDSFEDSELGPIPIGWNVKEIGKTLSLVGGSTPSTANSDYWDGIYTWTTPKDLSNQEGLITVDSARKITEMGLAKITSGLLEKGSVLMSSRAPIGYLAIADVPTAVNQGFIAFPFTKDFHPMFILNWLSSNMDEIKNRAGGSSFAEVSKSAFKTLPMLVPQSQLVHKFSEVAQPILDQLSQITYQNRTLRDLRDSLLPRLISGELEIPTELLEA